MEHGRRNPIQFLESDGNSNLSSKLIAFNSSIENLQLISLGCKFCNISLHINKDNFLGFNKGYILTYFGFIESRILI